MAKNVIKVVSVLLLAVLVVTSFSSMVFAVDQNTAADVNQFQGKGDNTGASSSFQNIIGAIITIVQVIGTGVAIIMLVVLAIKYISAAPGDKADIKKHAVVYVVGAVVLFAATGILGIVKNFASNISAASAS